MKKTILKIKHTALISIATSYLFILMLGIMTPTTINADPPRLNSWTPNPYSLPVTLYSNSIVTYKGYVYSIAGMASTGGPSAAVNTVYSAPLNRDGTVGTWTTDSNSLPQALFGATAVVYNGYVYVMGGSPSNSQASYNTVYSAPLNSNGKVGTWTTDSNSLPQALTDATTLISNGYVYVMGGVDQSTFGLTSYVYSAPLNSNGTVGTWTTNPDILPTSSFQYGASATSYNGYVYISGGITFNSNGFDLLNTVYFAPLHPNGGIGTWTASTNTLPQGLAEPTSVVINGYLYVMGGMNSITPTFTSAIYSAPLNSNGTVGAWTTSADTLPQALANTTIVSYNNYIYLIGGLDAPLNTVYYSQVPASSTPSSSSNNSISTNSSTTPNSPNTGFGKPQNYTSLIVLTITATLTVGIGSLIYRYKKTGL